MDSVLAEIYSTIIPSAPYIIAAYALVWAALLIYVLIIMRGMKKAEARIALLEEALAGTPSSSSAAASAFSEAYEDPITER